MWRFKRRRSDFNAVLCAICAVEIAVGPQWICAQSTAAQPVVSGQQKIEQTTGKDKQSANSEMGLGQKTTEQGGSEDQGGPKFPAAEHTTATGRSEEKLVPAIAHWCPLAQH